MYSRESIGSKALDRQHVRISLYLREIQLYHNPDFAMFSTAVRCNESLDQNQKIEEMRQDTMWNAVTNRFGEGRKYSDAE
jgi:hypothetical protein